MDLKRGTDPKPKQTKKKQDQNYLSAVLFSCDLNTSYFFIATKKTLTKKGLRSTKVPRK